MNTQNQHRFAFALALVGFLALFVFVVQKANTELADSSPTAALAAVSGAGSGMTGWWGLNDGAGAASAADQSGSGQNGTFVGFPSDGSQWVTGRAGAALAFSGSDHITLPAGAAQIGSGDFSASLWADYAGPASGNTYLGVATSRASGASGTEAGWAFVYINATTIAFQVDTSNNTGTAVVYTTVSPGWHHFVGTLVNGSSVDLYVDGALAKTATTNIPSGNLTSPFPVRIGGFAGGVDDPFVGKVQDFRAYDRALTASDVSQLYSAGPTTQTASGASSATGGTSSGTQAQPTGTAPMQTTAPTAAPTQTAPSQAGSLGAPTNITAIAISPNQINVSWAPVAGAQSYKVYRNTSYIGASVNGSFQSTGLNAATTYGYTVSTVDSSGNEGSQSGSVSATTPPAGTQPTGYVLSVYKYEHAGQGTVTATVNGNQVVNCGSDCTEVLPQGASITLTAQPAAGSSFSRFEDCPGASGNTCTIAMPNWNMSIGVVFTSPFTPGKTLSDIVHDGMTWVFTGDSFTTLETYSAYIESYFELRNPTLHLHFRNAARSGSAIQDLTDDPTINPHVDPATGAAVGYNQDGRFDRWVYGWYPDVVSVDFSDNGHPTPQQLASDMSSYINKYIIPNHSTPVILGFWPINNATQLTTGAYMQTLSDAVDQMGKNSGFLTGMIWHEMAPMMLANLESPNPVNLDGLTNNTDEEHLNEAGTLAAATDALRKLGADGDVSDVTIDASAGTVTSAAHAAVSNVAKNANSGVDFTRLDARLPMAFDDLSRPVLAIDGAQILDMNRYMLTVNNLSAGTYDIYIDGVKSATVDSNTLASGWNMTTMTKGPIHDQLVNVLNLIRDKEGVSRARIYPPVPRTDTNNACGSPNSWWGVTAYNSNAGWYDTLGYRGDYLVAQLTAAKNMTNCFDNLIHAAVQPAAHTFSVRKASDTVSSDASAPLVSIIAPAAGATVSGAAVAITASASDDVGVAGVQFKVDGANVGAEDTVSPYTVAWDSTKATNASHAITAVARDAAGNTTTSSAVTVAVSNSNTPPAASFKIGDRVSPSQDLTNVRSVPAGSIVNTQDTVSAGTIVGGPTVASLSGVSYNWWNIDFDTGADGWVADSFLVAAATTSDAAALSVAITSTSTTAASATIDWTTNKGASSQVEYGESAAYGSYSALDATSDTLHSVTLTGLKQNTVYHFRAASVDSAGDPASSTPDMTFTTKTAVAPGALGLGSRVQAAADGTNSYNPVNIIAATPSLVSVGVWNAGDLGYIERGPLTLNGATYWFVNFDNSTLKPVNSQLKMDGWVDQSLLETYVSTSTNAPVGNNRKVNMYSGIAQAFSVDASDPDGDLVTISYPSATAHGARLILTSSLPVTQNNTSKAFNFIYTPVQGFTGTDSFQYTLSDGVNTSVPYTVTFNVQPVTSSTWIPPIGIPRPEFGIDETYRMYDDPANRNPALTYTQNAEGGYYTHYVDNTPSLGCSDTRTYGTATAPRCTVPANLPEGSVVEIHGGPYTYLQPTVNSYKGSKERPIFIRGVGMPRFAATTPSRNWVLGNNQPGGGGQYVIVEGISTFFFAVNRNYREVAFRNSDVYGDQNGGGTTISDSDVEGFPIIDNIVFYHNKVHDVGIWDPKVTGALCAEGVKDPTGQTYCDRDIADTVFAWQSLAENIWVLDSDLSHSEGDSVQVNAGGQGLALNPNLHHIYIGRNEMYENKQTATAIKAATHVVFSQNDMWGIATSSSSLGTATGFSDEGPTDTWWIFNRIHDSEIGTKMNGGRGPGPYYYIGNLIYDIHDNYPNTQLTGSYSQVGQMVADWHEAPTYFINNTFYDGDFGFGLWTTNWTSAAPFVISNNIIAKANDVGQTIYNQGDSFLTVNKNLFQGSASDTTIPIYWRGKNSTTVSGFEANATAAWASGNIAGDPKFVDPANGNFNLQAGSPAIGAGDSTLMQQAASQFYTTFGSDIRKDFNGNNRPASGPYTLGAIEYGATGGNQPPPAVIPPTTTTPPANNPPSGSGATDSDSDGVPDASDACANTPAGRAVNSVGCPLPTTTGFTVAPSLSSANLNAVSGFSLSNAYGKITWSPQVSLVHNGDRMDLAANISITRGTVTVNSAVVPELNAPATITFYNVTLSRLSALKILRDGTACPGCAAVTYQNNTLSFTVPGFSTYSILDGSAPADTTAPTVSITSPANGSTLSGSAYPLTVSANDDTAVIGVQYKIDGADLGGEALAQPFASTIDTSSLSDGSHTLVAVARDAAGNIATSAPVAVTVSNAAPGQSSGSSSSSSGSSGGGSAPVSSGGSSPVISSGGGGYIPIAQLAQAPNNAMTPQQVRAAFTVWLSPGATDVQVKALQQALNANGFMVAAAGAGSPGNESFYFGPATEAALKRFQCAKLGVCAGDPLSTGYGATGPRTRAALSALPGGSIAAAANASAIPASSPVSISSGPVTSWLTVGETDAQVAALQRLLNAKGFLVAASGAGSPGNETTYFGPATEAALKRFQCAKLQVCSGDPSTTGYGATGPRTRAALGAK